ncbi:MAG: NAD(+) synthase [Oscillospiraceae bacterium]|jgi:NAD+ synthase|nr:NAD(+) synthase [Oscillospiraceae bacterium]
MKALLDKRVAFIRRCVADANAAGIIYGNSGGKDSALVGALCKMACENTVGLIMPCACARGYGQDRADAEVVAKHFGISTRFIDLAPARERLMQIIGEVTALTDGAAANIAPRLRMTALYAAAASENRLVAGTGNRSEGYMGYFTKWGDGACDFNPIADLTVTEIYALLRELGAPRCVLDKAPSAGLYEGQTDEGEMGVTYKAVDAFLLNKQHEVSEEDKATIERYHAASEHKRALPKTPPQE